VGNVVNTIVKMFTRKAVGKAMRSAKKSTGANRGKASWHPEGRRKKRHANANKGKKAVD
jgi:hypothetical protein